MILVRMFQRWIHHHRMQLLNLQMPLQKKEIDALKSEWESLKGKVDSYKSFVNKEEEIEAFFYKKVADKCTAMCTTGYEASLAYAKSNQ